MVWPKPEATAEDAPMDVAFLTIAELQRLYATHDLSPVEATKALLGRIAAHDGKLHSFLRLTEEAALAEAHEAERELMAGTWRGPMHGIPYALKDIIETADILTTGHSKLRQHHVPAADAELVGRLKAGGGIMLGKLATWEFALGGPTWDPPSPPALNPWDPAHLPGGSSSVARPAGAGGASAWSRIGPGRRGALRAGRGRSGRGSNCCAPRPPSSSRSSCRACATTPTARRRSRASSCLPSTSTIFGPGHRISAASCAI